MRINFSKITEKFYKDEERWGLARANEPYLTEFMNQVGSFLAELHMKGYRFNAYHIDPTNGVLHASLVYCCGARKGVIVENEIRSHVESTITSKTRYKQVIWEDLKQLKQ